MITDCIQQTVVYKWNELEEELQYNFEFRNIYVFEKRTEKTMKILIVFILFGFGCTFIAVTFAENDESQAEGQQHGRWSWNSHEKPNKHYKECCYNQTFENQLIQALMDLTMSCISADKAAFSDELRDHVVNCLIQLLDFVDLDSCMYIYTTFGLCWRLSWFYF